jgi:hypothetical protein
MQDQDITKARLTLLVSGNSPVELLFEMYPVLLVYVQSFEQNYNFKKETDMLAHHVYHNYSYPHSDTDSATSTNDGIEISNPLEAVATNTLKTQYFIQSSKAF